MTTKRNINAPLWSSIEDAIAPGLVHKKRQPLMPYEEAEREQQRIIKEQAQHRRSYMSQFVTDEQQRLSDRLRSDQRDANIAKTKQLQSILPETKTLKYKDAHRNSHCPVFVTAPNRTDRIKELSQRYKK